MVGTLRRPLRVSVTALDGHAFYTSSDFLSAEQYAVRLKGEEPESEAMALGSFLHKQFEDGNFAYLNHPDVDRIGRVVEIEDPQMTEMKVEYPVEIAGESVVLVGKIDAVCGRRLVDYKFTKRIDPDRLQVALQWRCYLMMLPDYDALDYQVFMYQIPRARRGETTKPTPRIVDHRTVTVRRYEGIEDDVLQVLGDHVRCLREMEQAGLIAIGPTEHRGYSVMNSREERAWRT